MKFISGKKLSMTQIWSGDAVMAVTPVLAGPCTITQIKSKAKDGYEALQLAYGERKAKNINKPQLGHYKKTGVKPAHVREFRLDNAADFKTGDVVSVETFAVGDKINVTGVSKGRGFQGVIKRHGFHGFRKTHGNKDQERMPGSIGPKGPAHVFKGMRMGGRMGGERVTTTNLEVAAIDAAQNIIFVKGAVPGAINGFVIIKGDGELKVNLKSAKRETSAPITPAEEITEEIKEETEGKVITEAGK
ncbi:MAG: 50S ribosomal protein L3 [Candidatus Falkowbacteria bacterium]|nr:50S ribosomal protein L3 [Candidatus Falkowbacteria bacterium]